MRNTRKLIGLCGRKGSGKGTLATYLNENKGFTISAFATYLKYGCAYMFSYPNEWNYTEEGKNRTIPGQNFTVRKALQVIGTEGGRSLDPDVWIKRLKEEYYRDELRSNFVIEDVRHKNEGDWIRSEGGILVKCVNLDTMEEPEHSSEDISWLTDPDYITTCTIVVSTGEGWGAYRDQVPQFAEAILRVAEEKAALRQ